MKTKLEYLYGPISREDLPLGQPYVNYPDPEDCAMIWVRESADDQNLGCSTKNILPERDRSPRIGRPSPHPGQAYAVRVHILLEQGEEVPYPLKDRKNVSEAWEDDLPWGDDLPYVATPTGWDVNPLYLRSQIEEDDHRIDEPERQATPEKENTMTRKRRMTASEFKEIATKDKDYEEFVDIYVVQALGIWDYEIEIPEGTTFAVYVVEGNMNGNIIVFGPGDGDASRDGNGRGSAYRYGGGIGSAVRHGTGNGDAVRGGAGNGDAIRSGEGIGDAHRTGEGGGNALRGGYGIGDAYRCDGGNGDAVRSGLGKGHAHHTGIGGGMAKRNPE